MLRKAADFFVTAYLLIIFSVYPFYIQNGYADIGEAKNRFFLSVSLAAFCVLGVIALLFIFFRVKEVIQQKRAYLFDWDRISATDLFVLFYATTVFLSYVLSDFREEALWGTEGWYIGTIPLLLLCGLYFLISRMWNASVRLLYFPVAASGIVFLLGICNRFSCYPIPLETVQPDFISTLGNINWYCGYLSVIAPIGIGLFVFAGENGTSDKVRKCLLGLYALVAFMSGFCQGSSSVFLWFGALFLFFLWFCLEKEMWLNNWMQLVIIWGVSAQLVRLMRYFLPGRYNYDLDNLCGYLTGSSLTLWIALAGLAGYVWMVMAEKRNMMCLKTRIIRNKKLILFCVCIMTGLWLLISVSNTILGIDFIKNHAVFDQVFSFDKNWGNGRGAAFYAGIRIFREQTVIHKLFGVGADCFSKCAYSIQELSESLSHNFGNARLTNAHNELLTGLVNTGILGVFFYLGIFVSFIAGCAKKAKDSRIPILFAAGAICYLVHNMISFAQVLNLPFVFLLMGMGMAVNRKE